VERLAAAGDFACWHAVARCQCWLTVLLVDGAAGWRCCWL